MLSSFSLDSSVEGLGHLSASKQCFSVRHFLTWALIDTTVCDIQSWLCPCLCVTRHSPVLFSVREQLITQGWYLSAAPWGLKSQTCTARTASKWPSESDRSTRSVNTRSSPFYFMQFLCIYLPDVLKYYDAQYYYIIFTDVCAAVYYTYTDGPYQFIQFVKREFLVMTKFAVKVSSVKSI